MKTLESPWKEIYRVYKIFLILIKVLHTYDTYVAMIFIGNVSDHQSQKLDMVSFVQLVVQGSNKLSHNCLSQDLNTLYNVLSFCVFD
jgi:hypothetical protein